MSGPSDNKYARTVPFRFSFANCFLRWRGGPSRQASQRNANRDKTGGQGGARENNNAWGMSNPPQEQHVPVRGFNTAEVKNILKKGPRETKSCTPYKSTTKDGPNQRSTPSGPKAHFMGNGKDFFVELRKQIAALQRGGPPVGG
ncbi:unnamed protein product [Penicillium olsonii]|uniref:Uncharacterized protein n=1 Tax=Penicillium olsonii TaxID=99116 RepID=A0A9W4IFP1_PENOL|nr:unnamed protein product [Penicillium olsonii]CAG8175270.1 unnamed protein product [Penicillium olsonii]CAG8269721.1 unnamed protein product [Penicillium olsonii]